MGAQPVNRVTIGGKVFPVFKSTYEEAAEAVVYIRDLADPALCDRLENHRLAAKLIAPGHALYCELLWADREYMDHRTVSPTEERALFLSGWQRYQLRLPSVKGAQTVDDLPVVEVRLSYPPFAWLMLSVRHPQLVVVAATIGAILGVTLGILAIGLALIPLESTIWIVTGWACVGIGLLGIGSSLLLLYSRLK